MAGYRRPNYRLTFEGSDMEGLEVVMRPMPLGHMLDLSELDNITSGGVTHVTPELRKQLTGMIDLFGEYLREWNLEDEAGEPVPASIEGFRVLDFPAQCAIILAYVRAANGVASPLADASTSGDQSVEASIPMETL